MRARGLKPNIEGKEESSPPPAVPQACACERALLYVQAHHVRINPHIHSFSVTYFLKHHIFTPSTPAVINRILLCPQQLLCLHISVCLLHPTPIKGTCLCL